MTLFNWILFIFSWLLFFAGFFVTFACFFGFVRFSDFFVRVHAIKISNIYGISFILLGVAINSRDIITFFQLFVICIFNILSTLAIIHSICRIALNANIEHAGISRRKYNELIAENERIEAEKQIQEKINQNKK